MVEFCDSPLRIASSVEMNHTITIATVDPAIWCRSAGTSVPVTVTLLTDNVSDKKHVVSELEYANRNKESTLKHSTMYCVALLQEPCCNCLMWLS